MGKRTKAKVESLATPETLEESLAVIEAMRSTVEEAIQKMEDVAIELTTANARIAELEGQAEDRDGEIDRLRDKIDDLEDEVEQIDEYATDLARVRVLVKAGKTDDAIYDLDKVLGEIDPTHKAKTTAVAVMF